MFDNGNQTTYCVGPCFPISRLRSNVKTDAVMFKSKLASPDEQGHDIVIYSSKFFGKPINAPRVIHRDAHVHARLRGNHRDLVEFGKRIKCKSIYAVVVKFLYMGSR